jgi:TRAP-type C4-dicarboxylate transport system substrate-binding protein
MNTTTVLKKQVKKFVDSASEKELRMIYNLFEIGSEDWWEQTSKEHRRAVNEAIEEADKGLVIPHAEMVKKYRKWLKK